MGINVRPLLLALCAGLLAPAHAYAQERIQIASLDESGPGQAAMVDAYLYKPAAADTAHPAPALVFMHGCGGLLTRSGKVLSREQDWAHRLNEQGYVVLAVDSFTTRGVISECVHGGPATPQAVRPRDAYGALRFLQAQAYVQADRIGLMGWSHGGGTVLFSIGPDSPGRVKDSAGSVHDFRTAVAFYPGWCNTAAQHASAWSTSVPLLILQGEADTWTRAQPCEEFVAAVRSRNMPVELHLYEGAYHDFDFPKLPLKQHPEFGKHDRPAPITGTNEAAREDAIERVSSYLARYLKP